jgi:hypothetical protein
MKRWTWLVVGALGACGPKAGGPDTIGHDDGTAAAEATPCPTSAVAIAEASWGAAPGTVEEVDCVAYRSGGETLWLLDGYVAPENADMVTMRSSVVTPAGETRWADEPMEVPWGQMEKSATTDQRAVDFDGDGDDELVWVTAYQWGGIDEESLVAAKIVDGHPKVEGDEIALSYDNSASDPDPSELSSCTASWEVIDDGAGKALAITRDGPNCDPPGKTVYGWNGTALVAR